MAIFKLEVELDWFDSENETLDDALQRMVLKEMAAKISTGITKEITDPIKKETVELIHEQTDRFVKTSLQKYVDGPIMLTDKYGDTKERYEGIDELLKHKFDSFMSQSVDENGEPSNSCSYGKKFTRLSHMLDVRVSEYCKTATARIIKELDLKMKEEAESAIRSALTDRLYEKVDLSDVLNKASTR